MKATKGCDYCLNGFQLDIEPEYDGSYRSIGNCAKGYGMLIESWCGGHPPVQITVQQWSEKDNRNHDIAHYTPKYCPECGRKITENEPYLAKNKRMV